jgi:hypothetical protein
MRVNGTEEYRGKTQPLIHWRLFGPVCESDLQHQEQAYVRKLIVQENQTLEAGVRRRLGSFRARHSLCFLDFIRFLGPYGKKR